MTHKYENIPYVIFHEWSEIKPFINGVSASLAYSWNLKSNEYQIITEPYRGACMMHYLNLSASDDLVDWETNFKEQSALTKEGSQFLNKITGSVFLEPSNNAIGLVKLTDTTGSNTAALFYDENEKLYRLGVAAKVTIVPPTAPAIATPVQINADEPLEVASLSTSSYGIPNGKVFHLQQITAGSEGDPNEKGSKVEVSYSSSLGDKIIERIYINGFSQFGSYPDTSFSRDGTAMSGSNGGKIVVKRRRLGGSALEIDCVVRGYLK